MQQIELSAEQSEHLLAHVGLPSFLDDLAGLRLPGLPIDAGVDDALLGLLLVFLDDDLVLLCVVVDQVAPSGLLQHEDLHVLDIARAVLVHDDPAVLVGRAVEVLRLDKPFELVDDVALHRAGHVVAPLVGRLVDDLLVFVLHLEGLVVLVRVYEMVLADLALDFQLVVIAFGLRVAEDNVLLVVLVVIEVLPHDDLLQDALFFLLLFGLSLDHSLLLHLLHLLLLGLRGLLWLDHSLLLHLLHLLLLGLRGLLWLVDLGFVVYLNLDFHKLGLSLHTLSVGVFGLHLSFMENLITLKVSNDKYDMNDVSAGLVGALLLDGNDLAVLILIDHVVATKSLLELKHVELLVDIGLLLCHPIGAVVHIPKEVLSPHINQRNIRLHLISNHCGSGSGSGGCRLLVHLLDLVGEVALQLHVFDHGERFPVHLDLGVARQNLLAIVIDEDVENLKPAVLGSLLQHALLPIL